MTKLYKTYRNASKSTTADAVTIDGIDGFAHVADLRVAAEVVAASYSWAPVQLRTLRLVRVAGGEFGLLAEEGAAFPAYAQRLFSAESAAREAFAAMRAAYEGAGSKWAPVNV